jgi:hypothetical protein
VYVLPLEQHILARHARLGVRFLTACAAGSTAPWLIAVAGGVQNCIQHAPSPLFLLTWQPEHVLDRMHPTVLGMCVQWLVGTEPAAANADYR